MANLGSIMEQVYGKSDAPNELNRSNRQNILPFILRARYFVAVDG
jgi:hypothetical protein